MPQQEGGQRTKKAINRRNIHGNKEIKSISAMIKEMQVHATLRYHSWSIIWQRLKGMVRPGRQGQGEQKLS